jgi:flagellin
MIGTSSPSFINKGLRSLNSSLRDLTATFTKLASGLRINKASDDAAGLAVASNLSMAARLDSQALRNVGDAQSALTIADGAVTQIQGMNERRAELAMQAANGTYSDEQRAIMQQEFDQLGQEIQRTTEATEFNGVKLLQGDSFSVQIGADGSSGSSLSVGGLTIGSAFVSAGALDISTQNGAQSAIAAVKEFSQVVSTQRTGSIGAALSRLSSIENSLTTSREASTSAFSRLMDFDVASGAADLVTQSIRSQAGIATLAQSKNINALAAGLLLG